jgi:hypothetical protein
MDADLLVQMRAAASALTQSLATQQRVDSLVREIEKGGA